MHTKRIGKWVIVLLLLAALPAMTAVMAQGQEPAGKTSVPVEVADAAPSLRWTYWESEPNNTMGQADVIALGDVVGAGFDPRATDVDYFKFQVHEHGTAILIDTDDDGADADTVVRLYRADGTEIGYDDDAYVPDEYYTSLLYRVLVPGWYYIRVNNHENNTCDPDVCTYLVMATSPLLISAAAANLGTPTIHGITFESRDILALSFLADDYQGNAQYEWNMLVDASDVGFTKPLVNLSTGWVCNDSHMAVSFSANQPVVDYQGVSRTVKPWDWMVFNLVEAGPNTEINNIEYHPGTAHGLSTKTEKLDALALKSWQCGGNWQANAFLSTVGAAAVPKPGGGSYKFADEDLFISEIDFDMSGWATSAWLDGSSEIPGLGVEDVFAVDVTEYVENIYLTILGNGRIANVNVTQKDIFVLGFYYSHGYEMDGIVWHGPDYGWNFNIDAFDWPGW